MMFLDKFNETLNFTINKASSRRKQKIYIDMREGGKKLESFIIVGLSMNSARI